MKVVPKLSAKLVSKVTILLFIVTCELMMSCKYVEKIFPQIKPQEAEEVKNICSNLKPPPSFVKTRQRDSVKPNTALRSMQYSSPAEPEEVERYVVNLLTHSGWSYQKKGFTPADQLFFKKGKFTIYIESPNLFSTSDKVYLVDCSIGI